MKSQKLIYLLFILLLQSVGSVFGQSIDCYVQGYPPALTPARVLVNTPITFQEVRVGIPAAAVTAYKFKDELDFAATNVYTYSTTGTFSVTVGAGLTGTTTTTRKPNYIEVLSTNKPDVVFGSCTGKIKIKINAQNYDRYAIRIGALPIQYVTNPPNNFLEFLVGFAGLYNVSVQGEYLAYGSTYISNNETKISTQLQVYVATSQFSVNVLAFLNPTKISTCEGEIKLNFENLTTDFSYDVYHSYQDNVNYSLIKNISNKTGTEEVIIENLNTLTVRNYIKIVLTNSCGEFKEEKITFAEAYSSTLPLYPPKLNATYKDDNTVSILWDSYSIAYNEFKIFDIERNGIKLQTVSNAVTYNDNTPLNATNCYKVGYTSACGIEISRKTQVCPIYLKITKDDWQEKRLEWSAYQNGENENTTYTLIKISGQGQELKRWNLGSSLQYIDNEIDNENQVLTYKVEGKTATYKTISNSLRLEQRFQWHFPDVFTPNNDTHNDTFFSQGLFIRSYQLEIYDRNGLQLFSSLNPNEGWDGTFKGSQMPAGVYIWVAQAQDFTGKTYKDSRSFLLSR
jgi:gliding motility-associated-like protein